MPITSCLVGILIGCALYNLIGAGPNKRGCFSRFLTAFWLIIVAFVFAYIATSYKAF